eukprot:SAG31_NODE_13841_length_843_cov_1.064516_2_plen_56_part_00
MALTRRTKSELTQHSCSVRTRDSELKNTKQQQEEEKKKQNQKQQRKKKQQEQKKE